MKKVKEAGKVFEVTQLDKNTELYFLPEENLSIEVHKFPRKPYSYTSSTGFILHDEASWAVRYSFNGIDYEVLGQTRNYQKEIRELVNRIQTYKQMFFAGH